MTDTTEGFSPHEAIESALVDIGLLLNAIRSGVPRSEIELRAEDIQRRMRPKPQAPERVWVTVDSQGRLFASFFERGNTIPYVPESTMPRGREVWMRKSTVWPRIWEELPNPPELSQFAQSVRAVRVLILEEGQ